MHRDKLDAFMRKTGRYGPLIVAALVGSAIVAFVAFTGSYQHQYSLDREYGQTAWIAGMQPMSVEGLVAVASLTLWFAARISRTRLEVWPVYAVLAVGVGQAALMNLASDRHYDWLWLGPEIAVWPAVAFFAAYEMAVWMVRNQPPAEGKLTITVENEDQVQFTAGDSSAPPSTSPPVNGYNGLMDLAEDDTEWLRVQHDRYQRFYEEPRDLDNEEGALEREIGGEPIHTCNGGTGPKGGRKTPGCPRCDALIAGAVAPKGPRRRR